MLQIKLNFKEFENTSILTEYSTHLLVRDRWQRSRCSQLEQPSHRSSRRRLRRRHHRRLSSNDLKVLGIFKRDERYAYDKTTNVLPSTTAKWQSLT